MYGVTMKSKHITLTLQRIEASICSTTQIILRDIPQFGQRTEGTEAAPNTMFLQEWTRERLTDPKALCCLGWNGERGGVRSSFVKFFSDRTCNKTPTSTEGCVQ